MNYCNNCSNYAQGNYQSKSDYSNPNQFTGSGDYEELAGKQDYSLR